MERKITNELNKWRTDSFKKPLLLYGITGSGKTYSALDFGKREYKNVVYFDCFGNLELSYVLEKNSTIDKLIRALSAISLETIFKDDSLIIFDNVTEKVITLITKTFAGDSSYNIMMLTNNSDLAKKHKTEFVNYKEMGLVTFPEYLKYMDKEQLIEFIEVSFKSNKPMPFHNIAVELYNDYVLTGGYPNAIEIFKETGDYNLLSDVHDKNIKLIKYKLLKLDNLIDIKRGQEIYANTSIQLLKENKKFQYGAIKEGARSKEYQKSIEFMIKNDMLIKSSRVSSLEMPISKHKDDDSFKLYYNDSGILFKKMNINSNRLLTNNKLLEVLYENNVVATLTNNGFNIYHYHSGGKALIDIVIQTRNGKVFPIEILHEGLNNKSKSMTLSLKKYNVPLGIRLGGDEFKEKNNIKYLPCYACFCINDNM